MIDRFIIFFKFTANIITFIFDKKEKFLNRDNNFIISLLYIFTNTLTRFNITFFIKIIYVTKIIITIIKLSPLFQKLKLKNIFRKNKRSSFARN